MDNIAAMQYDIDAILENQTLQDTIRKINDLREYDHETYDLLIYYYKERVLFNYKENIEKLILTGLIDKNHEIYAVTTKAIKLCFT